MNINTIVTKMELLSPRNAVKIMHQRRLKEKKHCLYPDPSRSPFSIRSRSSRRRRSHVTKSSLRHYHVHPKGYSLDIQLILFLTTPELQDMTHSFYSVVWSNGKKNGYGHITFSPPFEDFVYATSWNDDIPSGTGYLFNQRTNEVIAHIVNQNVVELLSPEALDTPLQSVFTEIVDITDSASTETEVETDMVGEVFAEHTFPTKTIREGSVTITLVNDLPLNTVLDNFSGSRWEGMVWRGRSCGYGEYYDDRGELVYSGMSIDNVWEGRGTLYYDIYTEAGLMVASQGMWSHGNLLGWSTVYDRRGEVDGEGLWLDSHLIQTHTLSIQCDSDFHQAHCFLRELVIANNMLNSLSVLNLESFRYLEQLEIGRHSLRQCTSFVITKLSRLQSIQIGEYSFTSYDTALDLLLSESSRILSKPKKMEIENLAVLEEIQIGKGSFSDFSTCSFRNLPSLKTLTIGEEQEVSCNFFYTEHFSLHHLPSLTTLVLGSCSFYHGIVFQLHDLPSLISLFVGQVSFNRSLGNEKGFASLETLPSLESMYCGSESLATISKLRVKGEIGLRNGPGVDLQLVNCFWALKKIDLVGPLSSQTKMFLSTFESLVS